MTNGVQAPCSLRRGRHLGPGLLRTIVADADAAGMIDWNVSVDATICRTHRHGTNTTRPEQDTGGFDRIARTGESGSVNLQVMALAVRVVD